MTLKNTAADLPYGGGKAGIVAELDTSPQVRTEIAAQGRRHPTKFSTDADNLLRESAFCFIPAAPVFNYLGVRTSEACSMNVDQMGNWSIYSKR